jgi:glycosyltransferase involved in cell wall biosynthesis
VAQQGFDPARITVVQNAIDTRELRECLADVADVERSQLLDELGWPADCRIAIYCGSLYENKRFDLLMESADSVHQHHPAFRLLIVGGGPMSKQIEAYARQRAWVHWAGPKFGREKAAFLSLAEMWLNPGLVGLGILDAFCARLPLLTTDLPLHSPEIEYLEPGINGLITAPQASAFAEAIESLLNHSAKLGRMRAAAEAASHRYSIETMAQNFATGVERCLGLS